MSTRQQTVDYICEQAGLGARLSARKMFGEFALYLDGKVVALVCDDMLYVKPTPDGLAMLATPVQRPPYPGARPHLCIDDCLDDRQRLQQLLLRTAAALTMPKPGKAARPKRGVSNQ